MIRRVVALLTVVVAAGLSPAWASTSLAGEPRAAFEQGGRGAARPGGRAPGVPCRWRSPNGVDRYMLGKGASC